MEERGSFCLRAMGFLNSFSHKTPVNSMTVSSGVWCGGGLGKQRWKRVVVVSFCLRAVVFFLCSLFGEGFK